MVLYFFRHGSAGEPHASAPADQRRSLDRVGVQQCKLMGRALAALGAKVDAVVSSPLERARQSAQLVALEIGFRKRARHSPALLPTGSYQEFLRLLAKFKERDRLLLVGHNARLSEFLGKLISPNGTRARVSLKKGGVAKVRRSRRGATLQWCINPGLLPASLHPHARHGGDERAGAATGASRQPERARSRR